MKRILAILGIFMLMAGAAWGYQWYAKLTAEQRAAQFNEDVNDIFYAVQKYKEHVGSYPAGSNAEVVKALSGENSKHVFIEIGRHKTLNDKGELVDPWGTPFKIYFSGDSVLIRSAGPNKKFEDSSVQNSDDYIRAN
jgi:Type II secretion system (T2SS), protein G